jgi:halimadienyl-diphosphate synthase
MTYSIDALLTELRTLIANLGKGGGCISPSIYDTAQVLRLYPPQEDRQAALAWLRAQQQPDGGWGSPAAPYTRDVPTLAAVLAMHTYSQDQKARAAIDAGLTFLRRQAEQWTELPIDALPIAAEMILPYLLEEEPLPPGSPSAVFPMLLCTG